MLAGVGSGNELEQVYPADAQLVPILTDILFFPLPFSFLSSLLLSSSDLIHIHIEPAQNTGVLRNIVTRFFTSSDNYEGIRKHIILRY